MVENVLFILIIVWIMYHSYTGIILTWHNASVSIPYISPALPHYHFQSILDVIWFINPYSENDWLGKKKNTTSWNSRFTTMNNVGTTLEVSTTEWCWSRLHSLHLPNNLYGLCSAVGNTPSSNANWQWTPALQQAGRRQRHPCTDLHASLETFPVMHHPPTPHPPSTPPPPPTLKAPSFQAVASRGKVASLETDTASFSQVSAFSQGPDWCVWTRTWYSINQLEWSISMFSVCSCLIRQKLLIYSLI